MRQRLPELIDLHVAERPPLTVDLTGTEFLRWYWLKDELADFARSSGQKATGTIPAGQRCSQVVRQWMRGQIGPSFHFDAAMRGFFAGANGTQTLQNAAEHWRRTRNSAKPDIDAQFEYNRFTRAWYAVNPNGTRDQLITAWNLYRSRPVDERPAP